MWLLECEGELFDNKRVWLRPGRNYLFGRTRAGPSAEPAEQRSYLISDRTVSRKHLVVSVETPKPGDGSRVHAKSKLTITDNSKTGTTLDGEKFYKESRVLDKTEHTVKLGSWAQPLKIKWQPVVLTFSYSAKELKDGKDPLRPIRAKLEPLDIKTTLTYINEYTSHAVAAKRNTAKGLQALINGKYIVTEAYVDALAAAATPTVSDQDVENPLPSPLEEDYKRNWPKAIEYLPGPGREPHPRSAEVFEPNPDRATIFAGFMFVFCEESQYNNLADVINQGGGKAVKFDMDPGHTTVQDMVQYVRNLAGKKYAVGDAMDGDTGIVLMAFKPSRELEDWATTFRYKVAKELKQAWFEQNEFLDAILMCDTSGFRKPFREADMEASGTAPSAVPALEAVHQVHETSPRAVPQQDVHSSGQAGRPSHPQVSPDPNSEHLESDPSSQPQPPNTQPKPEPSQPQPLKRRGRRVITTSRFKGFDEFDPTQLSKTRTIPEENEQSAPSQEMAIDSQSLFVGGSQGQSQRLRSQQTQQDQERSSRKRRTPPLSPSPDAEDMVEGLLPAAAAMKRRRLEEEQSGNHTFSRTFAVADEEAAEKEKGKGKRKEKKKVDYLGVARERREAEEEAAQKAQESLMQAMEGEDVEHLRNLAVVEPFDIPVRTDRPRKLRDGKAVEEAGDGRWDPRWNGKKNFKKFKRQGEGAPNRGPRVIVGLEEVKKKDFGIGEDYWLESSRTKKKRKGRESASQAAGLSQREQLPGGTMASTATVIEDDEGEETLLPEEVSWRARDSGIAEQVEEGRKASKGARLKGKDTETQTQTQTQAQGLSSVKVVVKRPASGEVVGVRVPPAKRQQVVGREPSEDEDSEEDELKFKFRKRR